MNKFRKSVFIVSITALLFVGFIIGMKTVAQQNNLLVSNGFDYPVGTVNASGWHDVQNFGEDGHLGEDWNIASGGNSDCGLPVYAASEGVVKYARNAGAGWEGVVIIRHTLPNNSQVETLYGHLSEISPAIQIGYTVGRREQIGKVGKDYPSGWNPIFNVTSYCHLHLELRHPNSREWGLPGPGYSSNRTGWTDPSNFIDAHRTLQQSCSISPGQGTSSSELAAFQNAFSTGGGQVALGCPNASVRFDGFTSSIGTVGHYQTTERGEILYHVNNSRAGQAFAIENPLRTKWASYSFNSSHPLGYPTSFVSQQTSLRWSNLAGHETLGRMRV